jgi:hypothetical protein
VTPKSYLSFLNGYKTVYKSKKDEISNMADRMNTGTVACISNYACSSFGSKRQQRMTKNNDKILFWAEAASMFYVDF